ncbi:MAG: AAA family ATPase [Betaproteobacteria bacterium]|nr:MAG: AAA family ATPase [Betaproteobacteria bacterium]
MKPTVIIAFLGTQLDAGGGAGRWEKWRPTVALTQHEDLAVSRLELLYPPSQLQLAERVKGDIASTSPATAVNLVEFPLADPWDFGEVYSALYDWSKAYRFEPEKEDYWAHITTGTHVAQICMFLMVEARFIPGVLVQTAPPKKQAQSKPGTYSLIDLDLAKYDAIAARFAAEQRDAVSFLKSGIATRNKKFNTLIEEIERVAVRSKAPILLTGPTGAGKSFLARRMFELKKSRNLVSGDFVEVNCATLRGDGAASTLFGHKKGSFTGAMADRGGLLRAAHHGVLFLDEIGELGLDEQAMLLTAIEEKRFLPVGADQSVHSDFQLVAGTNRDLRGAVSEGSFREDLFARINLWTYDLPGLAARPEDIEANIDYLLEISSRETGHGVRFNTEARKRYVKFAQSAEASWLGNFRDLAASMTRLATLADSGRISEALVDAEIARLRWLWQRSSAEERNPQIDLEALLGSDALSQIDLFDQLQLRAVIAEIRQSRTLSDAGRRLYNVSRSERSVVNDADRLRKFLVRFDLTWERLVER